MKIAACSLAIATLLFGIEGTSVSAQPTISEGSRSEPIEVQGFVIKALRELTGSNDLYSVNSVVFRREAGVEVFGIDSSWEVQHRDEGIMHVAYIFLRKDPEKEWSVYRMPMPIQSIMSEYIEVLVPRITEFELALKVDDQGRVSQ